MISQNLILSPLNNASKERIKLKIAGYPGRVYYGKIDPGKADLFSLDFADLYESTDIQEMENAAQNYTKRLLEKRFSAFQSEIDSFFDLSSATMDEYITLIFQTSFNVPRIMGYLLHQCYIDRISKGQKINIAALKLASKKYYESKIIPYFDRLNRYALEPFEQKLDRYSQRQLLEAVVSEMKDIRKNILHGGLGGSYFSELKLNIPTSHFAVSKELEGIFHSLESNFFISKYRSMRDKEGKDVSIYGLFYGLTESERMLWGQPVGRKYRGYFVQRCFDFTKAIHEYLTSSSTIRCSSCLHCFPLEQKASIELYRWRCPNCNEGICSEVKLADDFINEVRKLDSEIMLPKVELEILATLEEEGRKMRANEIALLIDTTYQLVGRRTSKLRDEGLVSKTREDGATKNDITVKAQHLYFDEE